MLVRCILIGLIKFVSNSTYIFSNADKTLIERKSLGIEMNKNIQASDQCICVTKKYIV